MKNNQFFFSNSLIQCRVDRFLAEAADRFVELDKFNSDNKLLTAMFNKYAVRDLDYWVIANTTDNRLKPYAISWHDGTVVYTKQRMKEDPCDATALYEAPAEDRWFVMEAELLPLLLEAATQALKADKLNR